MRKSIYISIKNALQRAVYNDNGTFHILTADELLSAQEAEKQGGKKLDYVFKHFDMWNHNVEFIEQETPWDTPAVFVQFQDIHYTQLPGGLRESNVVVHLHIVNADTFSYLGQSEAESRFDLCELPYRILQYHKNETFTAMQHIGSQTNDDHAEMVESIESFTCTARG